MFSGSKLPKNIFLVLQTEALTGMIGSAQWLVLAEMPVRSPRKCYVFTIKVSRKPLVYFENRNTGSATALLNRVVCSQVRALPTCPYHIVGNNSMNITKTWLFEYFLFNIIKTADSMKG